MDALSKLKNIDSELFKITNQSFNLEQLEQVKRYIEQLESAAYDKGSVEGQVSKSAIQEGYDEGYGAGYSQGFVEGQNVDSAEE